MKIWPFDVAARETGGRYITSAQLKTCLEPFEKIRKAVGDRMDIMVEFHSLWNLPTARRIARELEAYKPIWFEDPIVMNSPQALAEYARGTPVWVCASETLGSRWAYKDYFDRDAMHVAMVDLSWAGGLTEGRKIASMAATYHGRLPRTTASVRSAMQRRSTWRSASRTRSFKRACARSMRGTTGSSCLLFRKSSMASSDRWRVRGSALNFCPACSTGAMFIGVAWDDTFSAALTSGRPHGSLQPQERTMNRPHFDVVLRNGSVVDGTGRPAVTADLAISGRSHRADRRPARCNGDARHRRSGHGRESWVHRCAYARRCCVDRPAANDAQADARCYDGYRWKLWNQWRAIRAARQPTRAASTSLQVGPMRRGHLHGVRG